VSEFLVSWRNKEPFDEGELGKGEENVSSEGTERYLRCGKPRRPPRRGGKPPFCKDEHLVTTLGFNSNTAKRKKGAPYAGGREGDYIQGGRGKGEGGGVMKTSE